MKLAIKAVKKVIVALCILYTINLIISQKGVVIPINVFSIGLVSALGMPAVFGIIFLKSML